jgi:hypothetical protein
VRHADGGRQADERTDEAEGDDRAEQIADDLQVAFQLLLAVVDLGGEDLQRLADRLENVSLLPIRGRMAAAF